MSNGDSLYTASKLNFSKLISIEINSSYIDKAKKRFSKEIENNNLKVIDYISYNEVKCSCNDCNYITIDNCRNFGYKEGSEKFADCVKEIYLKDRPSLKFDVLSDSLRCLVINPQSLRPGSSKSNSPSMSAIAPLKLKIFNPFVFTSNK